MSDGSGQRRRKEALRICETLVRSNALDVIVPDSVAALVTKAELEGEIDGAEGADMWMVKPAGPYLDVIRSVREAVRIPVAACQVSGEHAQIHAAARNGWLDLGAARDESLLAIRRAGADVILSCFALDFARACAAG